MQMTINIGYGQVFELARQLPPRERARLAKEIAPAELEPALPGPEPYQDLIVLERGDGYSIVQVPYSDTEEGRARQKWTEQLQKQHREAHPELFVERSKEEIEKNRQEALRLALECPVATQEEIDNQNEFRRLFRWRSM